MDSNVHTMCSNSTQQLCIFWTDRKFEQHYRIVDDQKLLAPGLHIMDLVRFFPILSDSFQVFPIFFPDKY